ncbi:unnamed protein product, partial [marine sediment metagenome]
HLQIEAMKLAFADLYQYISDPDYMNINYQDLLKLHLKKEQMRKL